jgi:hypothetical protein
MGMRHLVTWLTICVLAAGCARGTGAASAPASAERSITAATQLPAGELLTGVLGADSTEGCAYLETEDGTRYEVIYPDGWTLDRAGPTLTDPDGSVVARGGDEVAVRGSLADDMASTCQVGPIFRATEVVSP